MDCAAFISVLEATAGTVCPSVNSCLALERVFAEADLLPSSWKIGNASVYAKLVDSASKQHSSSLYL
jgi:hypothetical protein